MWASIDPFLSTKRVGGRKIAMLCWFKHFGPSEDGCGEHRDRCSSGRLSDSAKKTRRNISSKRFARGANRGMIDK